ncbi:MAG: hypothetical protein WD648_10940 [Planctomycetaceae bacterium]
MAKQQNTYAKRQREMEKKQKADEKRQRRKKRVEQKAQLSQLDHSEIASPEIAEL